MMIVKLNILCPNGLSSFSTTVSRVAESTILSDRMYRVRRVFNVLNTTAILVYKGQGP